MVPKHRFSLPCSRGAAHGGFTWREPVDSRQGIVLKGVGNARAKPHFDLHLFQREFGDLQGEWIL